MASALCGTLGRNSSARSGRVQASAQASTSGRAVQLLQEERPSKWQNVVEGRWKWKDYGIRYQRCGDEGPAVLLVHGFGASADHWRKNTPEIGKWAKAYAIDLLGYGYSDKPLPSKTEPNQIYNFEAWGDQLKAFTEQVVGEEVTVVCNSVGGLAGLCFAAQAPELVRGVQCYNISLRMLHRANQSALQRPFVAAFQSFLRSSPLGPAFFRRVATARAVKQVLSQAYCDASTVTDELVECVLRPGLQPGAAEVFLDFISYSGGPLPAQLIKDSPVPVGLVWGAEDPWEKVAWGRSLAQEGRVEDYTELPNVGHCPQDEAPQLVNPLIRKFVEAHAQW